jgi:hypothetical protein
MTDQVRKFHMGAPVFREGEGADYACLVRGGKFENYKATEKGHETIAMATAGTIFGELALIDGGRRMASARCVEEGYLVLIDRARFLAKLKALTPRQHGLFDALLMFVREAPLWSAPPKGNAAAAIDRPCAADQNDAAADRTRPCADDRRRVSRRARQNADPLRQAPPAARLTALARVLRVQCLGSEVPCGSALATTSPMNVRSRPRFC